MQILFRIVGATYLLGVVGTPVEKPPSDASKSVEQAVQIKC